MFKRFSPEARAARVRQRQADAERAQAQETVEMMRLEPGADDPRYFTSGTKLLGVYLVELASLQVDIPGAGLRRGQPYLDVSVAPIEPSEITPGNLKESHHMLAQYVGFAGLHAYTNLAAVGGITSKHWERFVTRQLGMNTAPVPAADQQSPYVAGAQRVYDLFVPGAADRPFEPMMMYQTPGQIVGQYPDTAPLIERPLPPVYDYIPGLQVAPRQ
jgi:hypothetical protein